MHGDAIVVGSGPNGLAAAITLAKAGLAVTLYEAKRHIGGGARSEELTIPGCIHDTCSAVHPLAVTSPFFRSLPLVEHGLSWIFSPALLAHPMENEAAVVLKNDLWDLPPQFGRDRDTYRHLFEGWKAHSEQLFAQILAPFALPRHPFLMAGFGLRAVLSARALVDWKFRSAATKALFAGLAAHSSLPLEAPLSAAVALVLALAGHAAGWPIPGGGSQQISNSLASYFQSLGGKIVTDTPVVSIEELPRASLYLLDVVPRHFAEICRTRIPSAYREKLMRFRLGPAAFKIDWVLNEPVPWKDPGCGQAATVHIGGSFDEIALSEQQVTAGKHPERPFVLAAQPSLFDPARAPRGMHTLWAYCHVPAGSAYDMTSHIENQIERYAPGFRDCIKARAVTFPADLEKRNVNCVEGDISGGIMDWRQLFTRPVSLFHPYRTPAKGIYFCSASTPPGPGVHGMCGFHAARAALKDQGAEAPSSRFE